MASQNHLSCAFLMMTTILVLSPNVKAIPAIPAIPDMGPMTPFCKFAEYPALCKSIVKVGSGADSGSFAIQSAIQATMLQAKQTMTTINKLIATTQDNAVKGSLQTCSELYDSAISDLGTSLQNLKDKEREDMRINLSAVMTDFDTCTDSFNEVSVDSPIAKVNQLLYQLSTNCLNLASHLKL
ncbi:Pectinesterase inhibitor domain [Macleaya cordata]|uniref:Pectinesterase inhibitor domain n=1 Tax=Macleaya cordata TaxID=56857 RepID=A0A200RDK4_MACCD|nr:Pectinesterase inhibitor domain [Macleaya cordata]